MKTCTGICTGSTQLVSSDSYSISRFYNVHLWVLHKKLCSFTDFLGCNNNPAHEAWDQKLQAGLSHPIQVVFLDPRFFLNILSCFDSYIILHTLHLPVVFFLDVLTGVFFLPWKINDCQGRFSAAGCCWLRFLGGVIRSNMTVPHCYWRIGWYTKLDTNMLPCSWMAFIHKLITTGGDFHLYLSTSCYVEIFSL